MEPSPSDATASRLARLRALPTPTYLMMATAEASVAALTFSPLLLVFFTLSGAVSARHPYLPAGAERSPVPQTYGGLLAAGARSGLGMTARAVAWAAATAALSAAGREGLRLGPRHTSGNEALASQAAAVTVVNALSGAGAGALLAAGFAMPPTRRGVYAGLMGVMGAALPTALGIAAPVVRATLAPQAAR